MSAFGRSFLRLAACAALRNETLVGDEVYDSRIAAVDPETFIPNIGDIAGSIGVYAEQESGPALMAQNGGPPFRPEIELVLEIAMQAKLQIDEGGYEVGIPTTDDQLEMTLDVIEGQAELALFRSQSDSSIAFRKLTKQVSDKNSIRLTDPKASTKLAMRYVTYKVEIADLELPIFERFFVDDVDNQILRLPPLWQEVVAAWPSDSPETEKALALSSLLIPPSKRVFEGVDSDIQPGEPPADPISATWEIPQS